MKKAQQTGQGLISTMAQRVPAEYNAGTEWTSKSIMQGYTQTPTQSHEQLVLAGLHTCNDVQIWS